MLRGFLSLIIKSADDTLQELLLWYTTFERHKNSQCARLPDAFLESRLFSVPLEV